MNSFSDVTSEESLGECHGEDSSKYSGRWTSNENLTYITFLVENEHLVAQRKQRRKLRIFKSLSMLVVTRTPEQCRSHHQKMEKKYRTLHGIVSNLRSQLSKDMNLISLADSEADAALHKLFMPESVTTEATAPTTVPIDPFLTENLTSVFGKDRGQSSDSEDYSILHKYCVEVEFDDSPYLYDFSLL